VVVVAVVAVWRLVGSNRTARPAPPAAPRLAAQGDTVQPAAAATPAPTTDLPPARSGAEALSQSLAAAGAASSRTPPPQLRAAAEKPKQQRPLVVMEMGSPPQPVSAAPPASVQTVAASNGRPPAGVAAPGSLESASSASGPVQALIEQGAALEAENRLVEARALYNRALHDRAATPAERHLLRQRLTAINETLVFSPAVYEGDPLAQRYTIQPGDSLSVIARKLNLQIDWRFLQRINRIADPRRIRAGQTIKVVRGPFHAVIDKSEHRLDLYAGEADNLLFIRSYRVGLGEHNQTPEGAWIVKPRSKLINPHWVNPRTGEVFSADNPENPIGERWIGLEGIDETTRPIMGIGIHGTIEPDSVGKDASMGCVRLLPGEVDVVYELLVEGVSTVRIVP